jgi:hypothetical protein
VVSVAEVLVEALGEVLVAALAEVVTLVAEARAAAGKKVG